MVVLSKTLSPGMMTARASRRRSGRVLLRTRKGMGTAATAELIRSERLLKKTVGIFVFPEVGVDEERIN